MSENIMRQIKYQPMTSEELKSALAVTDLTLQTADNQHAIRLLLDDLLDGLKTLSGSPNPEVIRLSPISSVANNFDRLRFPKDNVGRSSTYTRYIDKETMLRAHVTAMIPPTLDRLAKTDLLDALIVTPGLVYRRDVSDKTHTGVFHQVDTWRITRGKKYSRQDLLDLVLTIFNKLMPGYEPIVYEADHPYTLNGIEVYAKVGEKEIEILEAGIAHPEVLAGSGINPDEYTGLALGAGLERILMVRKNLPDIRLIRSTDPRITAQMLNLDLYKPVSMLPPVKRDMSYSVPKDYAEEDISEDIRNALGINVEILEEVLILSETSYEELPEIARQKLGIKPDQKNVLVRVVLRSLNITLTNEYANQLMDEVYSKINQGERGYVN